MRKQSARHAHLVHIDCRHKPQLTNSQNHPNLTYKQNTRHAHLIHVDRVAVVGHDVKQVALQLGAMAFGRVYVLFL